MKNKKKRKKKKRAAKTRMSLAWALLSMSVQELHPAKIRAILVRHQVEAATQKNGKLFRVRTLVTKKTRIRNSITVGLVRCLESLNDLKGEQSGLVRSI